MLNFTDSCRQRVVEGGEFELMIGRSSNQIEYTTTVRVQEGKHILPRDWQMVCEAKVQRDLVI